MDWRVAGVVLAGLGLWGCHNATQQPQWCVDPRGDGVTEGPVTWHQDIKPLFFSSCVRCHTPGNIGPFPLETFQDAHDVLEGIRTMVGDRKMPPWKANPCCGRYQHDTSLTDADVARVRAWVSQGGPEGTPTPDPPRVVPRGLARVDLRLAMAQAYQPTPEQGTADDTRCFLLDWPETETRYVTALDVKPGNAAVVHHALVLVAAPKDINSLEKQDEDGPGYGFSCPGGLVSPYSGYLGGWAPGFEATVLPADLGHEVVPGSKILLTVHYSLPTAGMLTDDQTSLEVTFQSQRTRKAESLAVYDTGWALGTMDIPANQKDVTFSFRYAPSHYTGRRYELFNANLHMHERGAKARLMVLRQDGTTDCLLQIDDYDHHWQGQYNFDVPKVLNRGDELFVECVFDNTAARQRVVFGQREEPRDLNWGEQEEMCVGFVTAVALPFWSADE